jgi:hypothetical protein
MKMCDFKKIFLLFKQSISFNKASVWVVFSYPEFSLIEENENKDRKEHVKPFFFNQNHSFYFLTCINKLLVIPIQM